MTTNSPNGAEVYVSGGTETGMVLAGSSSGSGNSDKLNRHTASVSSPAILNVNTWGYAVPSDITGNGVSMAGFGETSAYQTAADNTNAGTVIGGGAGNLKFAGVRIADSGSPVTMEKIYSGTTKIFPVYLGMLVGSNLAQGNYETNIYYTVIVEASDVAGGEITVEPGEVAPAGGETITVTSSLKPGTNNNSSVFGDGTVVTASDVKVKIGGEDCTDVAVVSNAGENLKVTCKTPAKEVNKYDVTLEIIKTGKTYTKTEGIEYKVHNPLEDITYMQDMTWEICRDTPAPASPTAPHIEKVLTDKRDNKTYRVVKAYDGKCWMAQNLRFNLTSGTALTPETSDVTSNWTPNHTTQTQSGTSGLPRWPSDATSYNNPRSHDTGNTEYGVYYNWNAATAGSGNSSTNTQGQNVPNSVCPKGWKLPRGDLNGNQDINDYEKLTVSYGGNAHTGNNALGASRLSSAPLSFPLSGYYNSGGGIHSQGSRGFFWSSTVYDSSSGFLMTLYSGNVDPRHTHHRSHGRSVRCVVREPDITSATYMQDVTKEMCDATPTPDSATGAHVQKTLTDRRDGKTYKVVKAYDGKCWMAENLKLYLSTSTPLTPATSDVSSNWTPAHNTGTGSRGPTFSDYYKEYSHYFGTESYGVYYTWRAATAGKGDSSVTSNGQNVNDSICPKGWKLPRSGPNTDANNDFYYLTTRYGGTSSTGSSNLRNTNTLSFPLSGNYYYSTGQLDYASSYGYFWSSTVHYSYSAYRLGLNSSGVGPQIANYRHYGFSVRCLVR